MEEKMVEKGVVEGVVEGVGLAEEVAEMVTEGLGVTEEVVEGVTEEAVEGVAERLTVEAAECVAERLTEEAVEGVAERLTEEVAVEAAEGVTEGVAKKKKRKGKHGIALWARGDQPREKLLDKGPQALSDAELVAILMLTGTLGKDAVKLARAMLDRNHNSLIELGQRSVQDLMKMEGVKEAKAIAIAASMELGRRRQIAMALERPIIKDSPTAAAYLRPQLVDYPYEVFGVLYLNQAGRLKHFEKISKGGITATTVDPRLIFKKALEEGAVSIIVGHNHPSGSLRPSRADEVLTARICEGARYLDIKLLDHIIVGDQGYFSFANEGLMS